ncbi:MAG: hypothetical protein IPH20_15915 [Bacteroidales bacterium]|nr:hypothetical protein [Bacteroidales bacterium]
MRRTASIYFTLLFFILVLIPGLLPAQEFQQGPEKRFVDKLFFGGGLGLQFGTITLIDISPVVGYRVTEKLETGIGLTYKYYKYNDYYNLGSDLKTNIIGGSIFARYHILENLFAHVEYESLRYHYDEYYSTGSYPVNDQRTAVYNSIFVGGGYRQRISSGSYFFLMALWNLNDSAYSPYSNPVLRMGVMIGR